MLKLARLAQKPQGLRQPPSGGCVLKHFRLVFTDVGAEPAAFRRLCVETVFPLNQANLLNSRLQAAVC